MTFELVLVDPDPDLVKAWQRHFVGQPRVTIRQGLLEEQADCDALITAGNSFGIMDGGVDKAVRDLFKFVQIDIQTRIRYGWCGELNVGAALMVGVERVSGLAYRNVIYTPTMRVPRSIVGTDAVYRAMWAALTLIQRRARSLVVEVERVACPGLGTLTGRVPPDEAARQMAWAWHNLNFDPFEPTWPNANKRHAEIERL